jgi:hypothetical protein
LQAEEWRKIMEGGGERVADVETGGEAVEGGDVEERIDEEPLSVEERRREDRIRCLPSCRRIDLDQAAEGGFTWKL